jgi:hypothetical protein
MIAAKHCAAVPSLLVAVVTVSCIAAPRTEFMGPNGQMVYAISCQTMNDCATQARDLCPDGHEIVPAASGASDTTARAGIGASPEKRLLIECKQTSP